MEIIVSLIEIVSFTCLLAGNLVGTSLLLQVGAAAGCVSMDAGVCYLPWTMQ
jgi:hypothetical protein